MGNKTMPLSKKNYDAFVNVFCEAWEASPKTDASKETMKMVISAAEDYFDTDNPRFYSTRFRAALRKKCKL